MLCRRKSRIVIVCWSFVMAFAAVAAAQDRPPKAAILVALSTTARDGAISQAASGTATLNVGETGTKYLYTNANGTGNGMSSGQPPEAYAASGDAVSFVGGGLNSSPQSRPPLKYDYLWQVDLKPISIAIDVVVFEMDWKRTDVKNGARQVAAGDHRTITLRQGERHLLDFVRCSEGDSRYANVFVELRAAPAEDAAVANLGFSYDLWLVHQAADGVKISRHAIVTGRQGEKLNFNFSAVPLPLDAAAAADADSPYCLYVSGTIVGRLKADGSIEIALQPTRRQRFPTGGGGVAGGTKTFVSRVDETTSIALPSGSGFSTWRAETAPRITSPRPGVTTSGNSITVNLKPFFEGAQTSILVTVHREK